MNNDFRFMGIEILDENGENLFMSNSYLVDSHCHLHDPEFFSPDLAEKMLARAADSNVRQVICIGTSDKDSGNARAFAEKYKNVFWTYGVHPEEATKSAGDKYSLEGILAAYGREHRTADPRNGGRAERPVPKTDIVARRVNIGSLVAIGEVGLDYHYPDFNRETQISLLENMLDLATKLNLPVSLHVRDAFSDIFGVLANFPKLTGVFHSFSDSEENLKKILDKGFYVGINGLATFANLPCYKDLKSVVPLERILLETDAPFLTPVPKRGIINESAYIKYIAEWLSVKLGISLEEITEKTTENVRTLFNLPYPELLEG